MSLSIHTFEVDNIVRYVSYIEANVDNRPQFIVKLDWPRILGLLKNSGLTKVVHPEIFEVVVKRAIEEHICTKFVVDYKKNPKAAKVLPYLIANVIYGMAQIIIYVDSNPDINPVPDDQSNPGYDGKYMERFSVEAGKPVENIPIDTYESEL